MKVFLALALMISPIFGAAIELPKNTPEVEAANAAHFARYNYEAIRNTHGVHMIPIVPMVHPLPGHLVHGAHVVILGHGAAPLGLDGRVVETPAVHHATVEHFKAWHHAAAAAAPHPK